MMTTANVLHNAVEDARRNGLMVQGAIEARYDVTADVAAEVIAEMVRVGLARQSDAPGLWHVDRAHAATWLRAAELADDLDHERGLHQVTKADLGHNIRAVKRLQDDREDGRRALRLARAAHLRAEDDAATWKRRAIVAAAVATASTVIGAAVILLLVWAVIA